VPERQISRRHDIRMPDEAEMAQSFIAAPFGIEIGNRITPHLMPALKGQAMADGARSFQKDLQAIERLLCRSKQLRGNRRKTGDPDQVASQREALKPKVL